MKYKWLQVSDLHSICKNISTLIMKEDLLREIEILHKEEHFSFLLITGDLSDKNTGYEEAEKFINEIIKKINVPLNRVFIVPGNHDVNRNIPKNRAEVAKSKWEEKNLGDKELNFIKKLIDGQSEFFLTYENVLKRKYPVDDLHFVERINDDIAIINLNTAWMCYDSNNESSKLHIGLKKVFECFNSSKLNNSKVKIVIGHHRIKDLKPAVGNALKSLFRSNDVDFYLSGHCHNASAEYDSINNVEFCSCSQGRAGEEKYPAGFVVGSIDTNNGENYFQFLSWNTELSLWTYDYSVAQAKHGKYYFKNEKFNTIHTIPHTIVDLKQFNDRLDYDIIKEKFNLSGSKVYRTSLQGFKPSTIDDWKSCIKEIKSLYKGVVEHSGNQIHIFPLTYIPLLVSFGYLLQNNSSNISIYQYFENESKWVLNQENDEIQPIIEYKSESNEILAVSIGVSAKISEVDISAALNCKFDLLESFIENPRLSKLNYQADIQRFKKVIKEKLDSIYCNYREIHLFIAAPAGLCIEIGRIIRESMYPDTYIYNYTSTGPIRYKRIINLKEIVKL